MKFTISIIVAIFALPFQMTTAHTWADELRVIARNGTMSSAVGYARAYEPRLTNYHPDNNVNKLPLTNIPDNTPICAPNQIPGAKPADPTYNILSAAPGDFVAVRYLENGHVTEPTQADTATQGKGFGSGLVYIYGTADSKATDMFNSIHKVWNKDGTGGDKRGKLLAVQYFDDMACFLAGSSNGHLFVDGPTGNVTLAVARQEAYNFTVDPADSSNGANLLCQTDFQIPVDVQANKDYSIYWVWDWPTMDKTTGQRIINETYTSCADIAITGAVNNEPVAYVAPQNLHSAAQWSQMVNPFVVDPTAAQKPFSLRVTTDLFATPTAIAAAGTTAHVQPTTAASITPQPSSTTQQVATATSIATQQGFTTVTVYVTQTSGVVTPTGVATAAQAGVGAPHPSGVTSASGISSSGVASASGSYPSYPSIQPFMKRALQIRGRNVN